ncbi:Lycopene beta and epsilon cyclase [Pseudoxanthomonas suwonensis 11-1]|uniref:Lycopene beta and epsilon cyclase n=1 Tax=Pseudoxanthomonas suwonensis (strain 11-1) TaxID=743721 RepID=E6WX42_PSEUU|nr:tryptophan 7-halogenase [Pseudoxanthomonas suwonensis]ADV28741.1 Lycopene beta and epsilon cyclase [Pseudoxanthomonas suwonensis 11-1]
MHTEGQDPGGDGPRHRDVVILGGGLAGLTLALQLRQRNPGLAITVVERRAHPVREAAHKVGESTVEIGAHYFADVLGLREHLETEQLRKYGLRYFFSEGQHRVEDCSEMGVSHLLPTPSWQLDRGRFENFLGDRVREAGVEFLDQAVVRTLELSESDAPHLVKFDHGGQSHTLAARFVVDASGRAGLIKRKLDLAQPNDHDANAVWWRIDGQTDLDQWSDDPWWRQRFQPARRVNSTNHMCGPGYWFWLIPLASGSHSLGIVCDAKMHPLETMNTHAKAMEWLRQHQPRVHAALDKPGFALQDFLFLRHFSYGCRQVYSEHRWALTGEAGLFLDPFYSPGSDFIAISNTYVCELVELDRAGKRIGPYAELYQQLYFSFYENTLTLYQDQYPIFGHPQVMPVKVLWDYAFYWALLAPLFFSRRQADLPILSRLRPHFAEGRALNLAMQHLMREWGTRDSTPDLAQSRAYDQYEVQWCREMNGALTDELDDDTYVARTARWVGGMRQLAAEVLALARDAFPDIGDHGLDALLAGHDIDAHPAMLPPHWFAPIEDAEPAAAEA